MGKDDGVGDPVRYAEPAAKGMAQAMVDPHPGVGQGEPGEEGRPQHGCPRIEIAPVAHAQGKTRPDGCDRL
jgi:hypothetical protein